MNKSKSIYLNTLTYKLNNVKFLSHYIVFKFIAFMAGKLPSTVVIFR